MGEHNPHIILKLQSLKAVGYDFPHPYDDLQTVASLTKVTKLKMFLIDLHFTILIITVASLHV